MVVIVVSSKWFSFSSLFKWLNADFKESMAMRLDIKSATALAPHTPFNPKRFGKISRNGISKSTCLESPKKAAFFALPIA